MANVVAAAGFAVLGWIGKTLYAAVKSLENKHEELAVNVARNYVPRSSFDTTVERMEAKIDRVLDKLDGKANR